MAGWLLWVVLVAVVLLLLIALRRGVVRRRRRRRRRRAAVMAGPAALIGRRATVVERIINREGVGLVRIGGDVWTARALHDDHEIQAGTRVEVVEIRGATAVVAE